MDSPMMLERFYGDLVGLQGLAEEAARGMWACFEKRHPRGRELDAMRHVLDAAALLRGAASAVRPVVDEDGDGGEP